MPAMARVAALVLLVLGGCGSSRMPPAEEVPQPDLAVATDPISLYVVRAGRVEERRSGVAPAWSPDGTRLAHIGDHDGNVWVEDRAYPVGVTVNGGLAWTPDGRFLLYERRGIRLLDTETGEERLVAPGTLPALSPDGQSVAYLRYRRKRSTPVASALFVVPLAGGPPRVLARTEGPPYGPHFESRPQWLPDGSGVAVARRVTPEGEWAIEVVRLDGSREVVVPRIGEEFALSPDGRTFAYLPTRYRPHLIVHPVGGEPRIYDVSKLFQRTASGIDEFGGPSWSPDGREVGFYVGNGETLVLRVYVLDAASGKISRVAELRSAAFAELAWKPQP
jgi:dipeptidyl aminopeptidase/acylaminoacyl peptidase